MKPRPVPARSKPRSRHRWRRLSQFAVLAFGVALPWCSGFRIDMPALQVVYLGRPYVLVMIVPFLVVVWGLALLSRKSGRVFCGWACPYGSLVEGFEGLRTALGFGSNRLVATWMRRSRYHAWGLRVAALITLVAGPLSLGASLAVYLYPPVRLLRELSSPLQTSNRGQVVIWAWMALVMLGSWAAGFLVRFHFCRMVCIYGMGQAMAASSAEPAQVLRPRYRPETLAACGSCQACLKACFLDLDPRDKQITLGFSNGCFNCGDCIDTCETVQGHRHQPSLLSFERPAPLPRVRASRSSQSLDEEDGLS